VLALAAFAAAALAALAGCAPAAPQPPYGALQVKDGRISDSKGKPVQLRGLSTNGLQRFPYIVNPAAFHALKEDWGADVVRLAMYITEGGYRARPELKDLVMKGIDLAVAEGLYVIVDWHILTPGNPNDPAYAGAEAFFADIAKKYGRCPNVIYEIMNEPNGKVSWAADLKPYAEKLVKTIRRYAPESLILIGSGTWSQEVDVAAADPVAGKNLAYTVHFYAGTHGQELRDRIDRALAAGQAVFSSEWGTSLASGNGGPYLDKAAEWLDFLDARGIGWANWSLSNAGESSAALHGQAVPLIPNFDRGGVLSWSDQQLTPSGRWVRARLRGEAPSDE
jgi:endoglucanase